MSATHSELTTGALRVDPARSTASFTVSNLGFKRVTGSIGVVEGSVDVGADGIPTGARGVLDAASIDTGHRKRDADLRGKRFLRVADQPRITFTATAVTATAQGWRVAGTLRVAGTAAPIELAVTAAPTTAAGERRVTARGRLDRKTTGLRAPRFLIGRWIDVVVEAVLTAS